MPHQPPAESRITLLFEKFSSFVEGYASNLAMGGMFLSTDDLRPAGSIVDFEIKLSDGFQLVQGLGEVVWVRPHSQGPDQPPGLAVRFQALDDKGRELILKIMEEQVKSGGLPFDLETVPDGALSEPGSDSSREVEGGSPEPEAAASLLLAPRPDPADVEAKILGEDGFTLMDAENPPAVSPMDANPTFQELEFDAPWGEQLPEIPLEVLEEDLGTEFTVPEAAAPVDSAPPVERSPPVEAAAPLIAAESAADVLGAPQDAVEDLDDSFFLAQEAAEELVTAPALEAAGDVDFDDIDFSVASGDEAEEASELEPAADTSFDSAFELEAPDPSAFLEEEAFLEEAVFQEEEPSLEEDATLVGTRTASEEYEPTISTSGPPPAPPAPGVLEAPSALEVPPDALVAPAAPETPVNGVGTTAAAAAEVDPLESPPPSIPAEDETATAWPTAVSPVAAIDPAIDSPLPSPGAVPADVADEDDLFAEEAGAATVLRQALGGSRTTIAAAVLVLLVGAAYLFRVDIAELLGFAVPVSDSAEQISASVGAGLSPGGSRAADGEPGADSPSAGPPPSGVGEPEEVADLASEGVEGPPPVITVSPQPEPTAAASGPSEEPESETSRAPEPTPPSDSAAGAPRIRVPATRVDRISWRQSEGGIVVTVELDGEIADDRYAHSPLSYNPVREMIEIRGIAEPYVSGRIEVGSSEVTQIRVGHHVEPAGNEIHVVLDFPDASPSVAEVRNLGDRLEILVLR